MKTIYWEGDKAKYTGKTTILTDRLWFEIELLEGHLAGQTKITSQCPDCGLKMGQDQPMFNPCPTCSMNIKGYNN